MANKKKDPALIKLNRSTYSSWANMVRRCCHPKDVGFKHYGGRGISVCERWLNFKSFKSDMGVKPSLSHSLDRVDPNGNYEPSNCRWATQEQQNLNKRSVKTFLNGKKITLKTISEEYKISTDFVNAKLADGYSIEQIVEDKKYRNENKTRSSLKGRN